MIKKWKVFYGSMTKKYISQVALSVLTLWKTKSELAQHL